MDIAELNYRVVQKKIQQNTHVSKDYNLFYNE